MIALLLGATVAATLYAVYKHVTLASLRSAVLAELAKVELSAVAEVKTLAARIKAIL